MDVTDWAAHSAEHRLQPQDPFTSFAQARAFARRVLRSSIWRQLVKHQHDLAIAEADIKTVTLERNRPWQFTRATLAIPSRGATPLGVLHALAHAAAPSYGSTSIYSSDRGAEDQRIRLHPHGPSWASTFDLLVEHFDPDLRIPLLNAFTHYGTHVMTTANFMASILESQQHEADLATTDQTLRYEDPARHVLLDTPWDGQHGFYEPGSLGRVMNIHASILASQGRPLIRPGNARWENRFESTAADLTKVIPSCTAADLNTIAKYDTVLQLQADHDPTEARRLERTAMAAAIYYSLDPVWLRTSIGLTRWDTRLDDDEAHQLNPGWWRYVQDLNRLHKARPSRWTPRTLGQTAEAYDRLEPA